MVKLLKFLLAIILFPITLLVIVEDGRILLGVVEHLSAAISFLLGAVVYASIHYRYYNFSRMYVFCAGFAFKIFLSAKRAVM